jgi:hypothetical protein
VLAFVKYYLASSAKLSSEVGYVPVSDEVAAENEAKLAEVLGGEPVAAN